MQKVLPSPCWDQDSGTLSLPPRTRTGRPLPPHQDTSWTGYSVRHASCVFTQGTFLFLFKFVQLVKNQNFCGDFIQEITLTCTTSFMKLLQLVKFYQTPENRKYGPVYFYSKNVSKGDLTLFPLKFNYL